MFRRSIVLGLILTASAAAISAQAVPAPKADGKGVMVFSRDDGSYLGIQGVGITSENLAQYGLKEARGVGIEKVMENSPAEKAGLQKGDVIIRFDDEEVKSSMKLTRMIGEVSPDQKAKLTVLRGGEEREITVTMGKRQPFVFERGQALSFPDMPNMPNMQNMPAMPDQEFKLDDDMFKGQSFQFPKNGNFVWNFNGGRRIGISSEPLTKQLGDFFGIADGKGLLVTEVRADSPAAKAGLKAGDIVVEANGKPIAEATDLVQQINAKKEGDMEITFIRDKNRQTIKVTPEDTKDGDVTFFEGQPGFRVPVTPRTLITPVTPATPGMTAPAPPAPEKPARIW
jgi:membrane-associated protease RseP (regulator of RpoE activity)